MEVICNNVELICSERICCYDNKSIKIVQQFDEESALTIVFNFLYDESQSSQQYRLSSPNNGTVAFDIYNFSNPLGSGLKMPIEIAKYKGRKIEIVFFIYKFKDANPILDFSLYLEKKDYDT